MKYLWKYFSLNSDILLSYVSESEKPAPLKFYSMFPLWLRFHKYFRGAYISFIPKSNIFHHSVYLHIPEKNTSQKNSFCHSRNLFSKKTVNIQISENRQKIRALVFVLKYKKCIIIYLAKVVFSVLPGV